MDKINILYIIDSLKGIAGAERNLYETVTLIDKNKFKPFVCVLAPGIATGVFEEAGVKVINPGIKRIYTPKAFIEAFKLIKFIRKNKIKIVITYHESSDFWGGLTAKLAGVKVLISSRRDMGYKLKKRHIFIYKILNEIYDAVITVSDAVKDTVFEREKALYSRIHTIHNGVNTVKFSPKEKNIELKRKYGINENFPVIGMVAAMRPIKGYEYFIKAASIVLKKYPEARFVAVGWKGVYEGHYRYLKKIAGELGINDKIIFTGKIENTEEIYSMFDIFAMSSINEGFSNAVLEAMSSGLPVAATRGGGTPEAVEDGKTGFLVRPRSSEELAEAIIKMLNNRQMASKMGEFGRRRVLDYFTLESMVERVEKIYEKLLERKSAENNRSAYSFIQCFFKLNFSRLLYYSGFLKIKKSRGVKLLAYHSIKDSDFDPLNMSVSPEHFERQIRLIKKYYTPVGIDEVMKIVRTGKTDKKNAIAVTFDDGYSDNFYEAFPILRKYEIPAAIFITVSAVENNHPLWFDMITECFRSADRKYIDLGEFGLNKYSLSTLSERKNAVREVVEAAKMFSSSARNKLINHLHDNLNPDGGSLTGLMLDWNKISHMYEHGIIFGTHTMNHPVLTSVSISEAEKEIMDSKRILEERTGITVDYFAYPNGHRNDYNGYIKHLIKKNRFSAAFTLNNESDNIFVDPHFIGRYCITRGMYLNLRGKFSKALFAAQISGAFRLVKKMKTISGGKYVKMRKLHTS